MKKFFLTAVGTEIGKTFLAEQWIRGHMAQGRRVHVLKPIISGWQTTSTDENDTARLLSALSKPMTASWVARLSPWRLTAPLSPDMAAEQEGRDINFDALIAFCQAGILAAEQAGALCLIEGVGGAFVPLNPAYLVADWMKRLDIPVVLVAGNYLGALSHTLSHVEALAARGVIVDRVIVNERKPHQVNLSATVRSLQRCIPDIAVTACPYQASSDEVLALFS